MNRLYQTLFILAICFTSCFSSRSQTDSGLTQIKAYCDSLDKLRDIQTVRKVGAGVSLDFIISDRRIIKIIERPSGYKNISAIVTYYLQNDHAVYIYADIEMAAVESDELIIELQKLYLDNTGIKKRYISKRKVNSDSLYNNADPVNAASELRKNARFISENTNTGFEKSLLNTIGDYLKAAYKKDDDPILEKLFSPFI